MTKDAVSPAIKQLETEHQLQEYHQESNQDAALCMCCTL